MLEVITGYWPYILGFGCTVVLVLKEFSRSRSDAKDQLEAKGKNQKTTQGPKGGVSWTSTTSIFFLLVALTGAANDTYQRIGDKIDSQRDFQTLSSDLIDIIDYLPNLAEIASINQATLINYLNSIQARLDNVDAILQKHKADSPKTIDTVIRLRSAIERSLSAIQEGAIVSKKDRDSERKRWSDDLETLTKTNGRLVSENKALSDGNEALLKTRNLNTGKLQSIYDTVVAAKDSLNVSVLGKFVGQDGLTMIDTQTTPKVDIVISELKEISKSIGIDLVEPPPAKRSVPSSENLEKPGVSTQ